MPIRALLTAAAVNLERLAAAFIPHRFAALRVLDCARGTAPGAVATPGITRVSPVKLVTG